LLKKRPRKPLKEKSEGKFVVIEKGEGRKTRKKRVFWGGGEKGGAGKARFLLRKKVLRNLSGIKTAPEEGGRKGKKKAETRQGGPQGRGIDRKNAKKVQLRGGGRTRKTEKFIDGGLRKKCHGKRGSGGQGEGLLKSREKESAYRGGRLRKKMGLS